MIHDVIVIGGSYAGMAASLQLLRARRSVLIIDATGITGGHDAFVVTSADGQTRHGRRVLFAAGVTDMPAASFRR